MEPSNKIIAYHISINGGFSIGDTIVAGKKKNGVYRKYIKSIFRINKRAIDKRRCLVNYHLERIRKRYYKECPSRFKALFVQIDKTKCKNILLEWNQKGYLCAQLLTLELTGHIHKCAHQNLSDEVYPTIDEIIKKSHNYWDGINGEEEYLFVGEAKVIMIESL